MLPFIAGIAAGAVAVVAYNNNKEIRQGINKGAKKLKKVAESGYEKTKEIAGDVKATVEEKMDCLKGSKEDPKKVEAKEENKNDK